MRTASFITLFIFIFWSPAMAEVLTGRENLAAFYAAIVKSRADGSPIRIHIVGDSKVSGNGVEPSYRLDQLLIDGAKGYPVEVTYSGHGGQNSWYLLHNDVPDIIANHGDLDLLIVDFGTNERVTSAQGGAQTIEQTDKNNRAAVAAIRAFIPSSNMSILFLGQTPANNWQPEFQQTAEAIAETNETLQGVAHDTNSAYFDTSELFERPHNEAGWMDQLPVPQYGDGNVHPGNAMNMVLVGELSNRLFSFPYTKSTSMYYPPSLLNGWHAYANYADFNPRAVLEGKEVSLNGVLQGGSNRELFELPASYRPKVNRFFTVSTSNSGTTTEVQVLTSGIVRVPAGFTGTYVALDQVRFRVD